MHQVLRPDAASGPQGITRFGFLDTTKPDKDFKRNLQSTASRLAEKGRTLPSSLAIRGVTLLDHHPAFSGSHAVVYIGLFKGQKVAVRRTKIYESDSPEDIDKLKKVGTEVTPTKAIFSFSQTRISVERY